MKVQFLLGGTQKGGTTALDAHLRTHPQIKMAKLKEVHFFDNEAIYIHPQVDYSLYHKNFDPVSSGQITGESTPIYMFWRPAPKRIWEYNPAIKWILLLRNPIERAYSQWNMEFKRGAEKNTFLDALLYEKSLLESGAGQHRVYSYASRGFYTEQIQRLLQYFPMRQMLILKSEELQDATGNSLTKVYDFLGVDNLPRSSYEKFHIGHYNSTLTNVERAYLKGLFEGEIRSLERMLEWQCEDWLSC